MKKFFWIFFYLFVLAADLFFIYSNNASLQFFCKPLLMPVLLIYFFIAAKKYISSLKCWVICAIIFSWLGDVSLLLEEKNFVFFLVGLSTFLVAQIFYIILFHQIRLRENVSGKLFLLIIVMVYYGLLVGILYPRLGTMKWPVSIYGVVICFMLMLALHTLFIKNKKAAGLFVAGALLFVASDTLLAFNKFYSSFSYSGMFVMLTYGVAQLFIISGAIEYITSKMFFTNNNLLNSGQKNKDAN